MTPREGHTCRWCGYPVQNAEDELCVQCHEWTIATGTVNTAVTYAAREAEKVRQKRWEKREARR